MSGRGPQLRAPGRHDHAETRDERRAEPWIRRRRGKGVPFAVHCADVRRVRGADPCGDPRHVPRATGTALERPGVARRGELGPRAVIADQLAPLVGVRLLEHAADRHVDLIGIAEEAFAVRARKLHRLGVSVQERQRARAERGDVVPLEEIQGHRHERTLRPRSACVHVDAAVRRMDRRLDRDAVGGEILRRKRAALLLHMGHDLPGDVSGVDGVTRGHDRSGPTARGVRGFDADQTTEQVSQLPLHEELADLGWPAVREEHRGAGRPLPDPVLQHRDGARQPRVDRESVAELDRGRQHVGEGEPAVPREGGEPRVARRRRDRARRADGHVVPIFGAIPIEIERRGPPAQPVDALRSGHPRPVHDDRRDTTEVGQVTFDHVQGDACRDAGVDRAAAAREHPEAGERREVVAGAHHVLRSEDRRAAFGDADGRRGVLHRDLAHSSPR